MTPAAGCSIQTTTHQHQSLPVNIIISDLTILEFNSWTMNLRKKSNFIQFKIMERYIKLKIEIT
jgi:hypothetical protein